MYLLGAHEIRLMLGGEYEISRQRAYQIMNKLSFPTPVADLKAGKVWAGRDVEQWIAEHRTGGRN